MSAKLRRDLGLIKYFEQFTKISIRSFFYELKTRLLSVKIVNFNIFCRYEDGKSEVS